MAADAGAEALLPSIRTAVAQALDSTATDFNRRPHEPIFVLVASEPGVVAELLRRHRSANQTEDQAEEAARLGLSPVRSSSGSAVVYGSLVLFNMADPNYRSLERFRVGMVRAMSYFASLETARFMPTWLLNGLLTRQQYRCTGNGASGGALAEAARATRSGGTPRLAAVGASDAFVAAEQQFGRENVAARAYAGTAFLLDVHGEAAMTQLLHDVGDGSAEQFIDRFQQLTGLDMPALDATVDAWLLNRPGAEAASDDGRIKVELLLFGDGRRGEVLVDEASAACLFDLTGTQLVADEGQAGLVGFSIGVAADGSFTAIRPSTRIGNTVRLTGRLDEDGKLTGTYRVINEVAGCDGGSIEFASP